MKPPNNCLAHAWKLDNGRRVFSSQEGQDSQNNPKGIGASSPRLACNAYLGCALGNRINANGVVAEVRRGRERMGLNLCTCLAVAVVALRQPRRVRRRNGSHGPLGFRKSLRRWTRRYSSQRDEFYHTKQIPAANLDCPLMSYRRRDIPICSVVSYRTRHLFGCLAWKTDEW